MLEVIIMWGMMENDQVYAHFAQKHNKLRYFVLSVSNCLIIVRTYFEHAIICIKGRLM